GQCLQVLLDNALAHGQGTITVSVGPVADVVDDGHGRGPARGARLCVADEGTGMDPAAADELLRSGSGRGLQLARSLAEAEGGHLRFDPSGGATRFCVVLPGAGQPNPAPAAP